MADAESRVVAGNGTAVEAGGVYLTFSGDPDRPYALAKVIRIGAPSPNSLLLWVRLDRGKRATHAELPAAWSWSSRSKVVRSNVAVFLAWGPPKFPIRVGTEAVTPADLAAAGPDERHAEPGAAPDPARISASGSSKLTYAGRAGELGRSAASSRELRWR